VGASPTGRDHASADASTASVEAGGVAAVRCVTAAVADGSRRGLLIPLAAAAVIVLVGAIALVWSPRANTAPPTETDDCGDRGGV